SARKNSLRRARGNTRVRRMIVTADLECGDFAGDERGATILVAVEAAYGFHRTSLILASKTHSHARTC
ncbi:MAG: hypothetical protein WCK86_19500, partial [Planctomycetia bacterium]